jgi:DNA-binding transcriptional LysR family regulator
MLDRLTLDQLRILIAVAETGSFSGAARRLGRVQSAVSQSVQSLEATLGIPLFDRAGKMPSLTEEGRAILQDARQLLQGAATLRARAESMAGDLEPELTIAVEQLFPSAVLMPSLKALSGVFPHLPVTLFTEGLSASEQRLREGAVRTAIYWPPSMAVDDLEMEYLASIPLLPVVASDHQLAREPGPLTSDVLQRHIQLVWTDRAHSTTAVSGGIRSARVWRFADLGSRLEYLLAGFGWCSMPAHLVEDHIRAGRLRRLQLAEHGRGTFSFPLYVVRERGRALGRAARWLVEDLRRRLPPDKSPHAPREFSTAPPKSRRARRSFRSGR